MEQGDGSAVSIYFDAGWETSNRSVYEDYVRLTPNESGRWKDVCATPVQEEADVFVVLNEPWETTDEERMLFYCMEPPCLPECQGWEDYDALAKYPISELYFPQKWTLGYSYDELKAMEPLEKSEDLSWVTSDKGKHLGRVEGAVRRALIRNDVLKHRRKPGLSLPADGHILRMDFLDRLVDRYPSMLDLYGRGEFHGEYYHGEIEEKWDGLADYRYSLAIENYHGPNYWSEKISEPLLAWCMPIYWGCTNLPDFLPEDSFATVDIEAEDAPERVKEIVESDRRERNLDAIAEARRRILDRYQIWPTVHRCLDGLGKL